MDIQRSNVSTRKYSKKIALLFAGIVLLVFSVFARLLIKPESPKVERNSVWVGEVKHGPLILKVRGIGVFVPEDQRWVTAQTQGSVERIFLLPGATLTPDSIILQLSNPELEQNLRNAELELASAEAELSNQRVREKDSLLEMEFQFAQLNTSYENAKLDIRVNEELYREGLIAERDLLKSRLSGEQLKQQKEILFQRIATRRDQMEQNLAPAIAGVKQERERVALFKRKVDALFVRAGVNGILQRMPLQEGQQVILGTQLAQVADPTKLKAVIRVPETQAKDISIGQSASIDNRNSIVEGRVARIDPTVKGGQVNVDISINGPLPQGARADQTVEGQIELENLNDVIYIARPTFGRENSSVGIFVLTQDRKLAKRRQIAFGRGSVSEIEVISGLTPSEQVILSDTSQWDENDQLRLY